MIDWLTPQKSLISTESELVYSLHEAQNKYEVIELDEERGWLVINKSDDLIIKFACFEFHGKSYGENSDTQLNIVFYGSGPSGNLRECRHTYWGEDGYVFYPNAKIIIKALQHLTKYFDMD